VEDRYIAESNQLAQRLAALKRRRRHAEAQLTRAYRVWYDRGPSSRSDARIQRLRQTGERLRTMASRLRARQRVSSRRILVADDAWYRLSQRAKIVKRYLRRFGW
jgi:hypothetical protein